MKNLLNTIPPAQALGIELTEWDGNRVELTAPLAKNLNDKGTAFAGSIDSMLDLAGWSAITLALRDADIEADVMIVRSRTEYTCAVRADMRAVTEIPADEKERVLRELNNAGRSRLALQCRLLSDAEECASMYAHYALIMEGFQ